MNTKHVIIFNSLLCCVYSRIYIDHQQDVDRYHQSQSLQTIHLDYCESYA